MPRSSRYHRSPGELPRTLQRSCAEAQAVFIQAHREAVQTYGLSEEAVRAAYAVLKEQFAKSGDRWVAKPDPAA